MKTGRFTVAGGIILLVAGGLPSRAPAQEPGDRTRFNPVIDGVTWRFERDSGELAVHWTGPGHLVAKGLSGWDVVSERSPYRVEPKGFRLFQVLDPWEGGRAVEVHVPASYRDDTPMPLIVALHGFTLSGAWIESVWRFRELSESKGFLYLNPDGSRRAEGVTFWNATDACCGDANNQPNDSAYLRSLVEGVRRRFHVDDRRIYFAGHSNGGFMAYRMACENADLVAAIVSVSGATFKDPTACQPSEPVSVLEIHSTLDPLIAYDGGVVLAPYPAAVETVRIWGEYDGHRVMEADDGKTMDLDLGLPGNDTSITRFTGGDPAIGVELWTIHGGIHSPEFVRGDERSEFGSRVVDWLFSHPKP